MARLHFLILTARTASLLEAQAGGRANAVVAKDGSGHYITIQEAIDAAPAAAATPWIIRADGTSGALTK